MIVGAMAMGATRTMSMVMVSVIMITMITTAAGATSVWFEYALNGTEHIVFSFEAETMT
jgi:hypothetical protein